MRPARALCAVAALVVTLGGGATAQRPRVRVEFQLADPAYAAAFTPLERSRLEDSAAAKFVRALRQNVGFLSFTRDRGDTTRRILHVILDQKERGSHSTFGEAGLHLVLDNPPFRKAQLYWRTVRREGTTPLVNGVPMFLAEFGVLLDGVGDDGWRLLVTSLLRRVSLADTTAVVWAAPPGSGATVEWLIPQWSDTACFDPISRLQIRNVVRADVGPRELTVIALPFNSLTDDPSFVVPSKFERFRGQIRAPLDSPATAATVVPESIQVRAVFVTDYKYDEVRCLRLVPL